MGIAMYTLQALQHRTQKNKALRRVREHYIRFPESLVNRQLLEVDMLRTVKQEALRNESPTHTTRRHDRS